MCKTAHDHALGFLFFEQKHNILLRYFYALSKRIASFVSNIYLEIYQEILFIYAECEYWRKNFINFFIPLPAALKTA